MEKTTRAAVAVFLFCITSCANNSQTKNHSVNMEKNVKPIASHFVSSPLRNSIRLELNAPAPEVWSLVGDPAKMPTYSSGLNKVISTTDQAGKCSEYTCYFKPLEEGGQEIVHTSNMVWFEPNKGWASLDEEPNTFGFTQSLTLITLEEKDGKTILNWTMNFNSEDPAMLQLNVSSLEEALNNDIAQKLIAKFGGRKLDNFVYGKEKS